MHQALAANMAVLPVAPNQCASHHFRCRHLVQADRSALDSRKLPPNLVVGNPGSRRCVSSNDNGGEPSWRRRSVQDCTQSLCRLCVWHSLSHLWPTRRSNVHDR
ncbi:uncharacterized protein MYCGRDRAFT_102869 [Zymoseptoria tritici IPO323]|uniref:Uncharacterized protein n=1 Tax=Zymoseptoria tritici (strain CBS 115943 / IPO323) TaxID=336722 RepID=F9WX11_ZYMTI|nr:uncharacterized protein MYCGRDRAFT_102869 [Zymoseptoria tritici IPO323]EGP91977.1 hypothetical protein MYCGRDRAFT_102869 [Zymoseptoria tritici IPO323]